MQSLLIALSAAVAVSVELLEALAIVLAVGASRSWRDAFLGAVAGVLVCAALALALGPLLTGLPIEALAAVVGTLLLLFGLEWLRKGVLRLAGRRSRSSMLGEFQEIEEELSHAPRPRGGPDWVARVTAFKGVLLEGVEVVIIVAALARGHDAAAPAIAGAVVAAVVVLAVGVALHKPLRSVPETELKYVVGILLTSFGMFFLGEGVGVQWPGGDVALLALATTLVAVSQLQIHRLASGATA